MKLSKTIEITETVSYTYFHFMILQFFFYLPSNRELKFHRT